jgi:thiol-disulfide isomerase/thioredoxin
MSDTQNDHGAVTQLRRLAGAFYSCSFAHNSPTCHDKNSKTRSSQTDLEDFLKERATEDNQCSLEHYYYSLFKLTDETLLVDDNDHQASPLLGDGPNRMSSECGNGGNAVCETSIPVLQTNYHTETSSSDITETDLNDISYPNKITGLGCSGSSTQNLSFFYMDSVKHWVYATSLAVDEWIQPRVAVTIIDSKERSQYVYQENQLITEEATAEFIWKFLHSQLEPRLKSAPIPTSSCVPSHVSGCVWEVVTDTFDQIVLDNTKDVLLLHYSPSCTFCKTVVPVILRLAHALESNDHVRIARINRVDNELPRTHDPYKPLVYPSFVLYLANR